MDFLIPALQGGAASLAAKILALSHTGVSLGAEIATAGIVPALSFGIGIGMIMAIIFRRSEAACRHLPCRSSAPWWHC